MSQTRVIVSVLERFEMAKQRSSCQSKEVANKIEAQIRIDMDLDLESPKKVPSLIETPLPSNKPKKYLSFS